MNNINKNYSDDFINIDHLVFGVIPKEGYKLKSYSNELITPMEFDNIFKRNYIPILDSTLKTTEYKYVYLVLQNAHKDYLFLSKISKIELEDEYGRASSQNHTAIIPKEIIERDKLSLYEILNAVDQEMDEFDNNNPTPEKKIEQLKVNRSKLLKRDNPKLLKFAQQVAPKNVVESIITLFLENNDNKIFLLWEGSDYKNRELLASVLVELINFEIGLSNPISYITGPPTDQAKKDLKINLIISSLLIGFNRNQDNLLPYTIPEPRDERIKGNENIYQILDNYYNID